MDARSVVLARLSASSDYVSGAAIAADLGLSRTAIWKQIESLKRDGYDIESSKSRGYRLIGEPSKLVPRVIAEHLLARGRESVPIIYKAETASTNTDAAELAREGAESGTVVIADRQSAGRGRLGRSWVSVPGLNLYFSYVVRPDVEPARAPQLALVAGIAVARVLESEGVVPLIKWPNDVVVGGRKIAGLLTEMDAEADRVHFVVVGIGVNLNSTLDHFPPELQDKAGSVYMASGKTVDRNRFTGRLISELVDVFTLYDDAGFAALVTEWNERSSMKGRDIIVDSPGERIEGVCEGLDSEGALLVRQASDSQPTRILVGDVTVVGGYE